MKDKIYILLKTKIIEVWEDSGCDCCGPDIFEYEGTPEVIGVYKNLEKIKEKLLEIKFDEEEIKYLFMVKSNQFEGYNYYLEETILK